MRADRRFLTAAALVGCVSAYGFASTQGAAPTPVAVETVVAITAATDEGAPVGDAALVEARARLGAFGVLPEALERKLRASDRPSHARARRVLTALAVAEGEAPSSAEGGDDLFVPEGDPETERIARAGRPERAKRATRETKPVPRGTNPSSARKGPKIRLPKSASASAKAAERRPTVRRVAVRKKRGGASLRIYADRGVHIGTVAQPVSGKLRFMIEGASASVEALRQGPGRGDVRVSGVRRGEGSVLITVDVPSGWTVSHTKQLGDGAAVHLSAPT